MRELTKEERKLYNAQVRERNEGLRQSSLIFGMLTAIFFTGAVFAPAAFAIYLIAAAALSGFMRFITSKLAG